MLPDNATLKIADVAGFPLFSQDLEDEPPAIVREFKDELMKADAVLFATPEHNRSISALLKNAIEWGNRPDNVWDGKAAAIMSASTGPRGGVRSQMQLRQILVDLNMYAMNRPELFVGMARDAFDNNLRLKDEGTKKTLKVLLENLVEWTARVEAR